MSDTTLFDLPTPSLILDRAKLERNIRRMATAVNSKGATLRPHMKTSKSVEVARLATKGQAGGIAVSTLNEAEYFSNNGFRDIQYAVCIMPDKLERVAAIQGNGTQVKLITDSIEVARAICAKGQELNETFHVQVELDCGEGRSGVLPDSNELVDIARLIDDDPQADFDGIMTHAGHSYGCRTLEQIEEIAEQERSRVVRAAQRVRDRGIECRTVSMGSTPTALHARSFEGITEVRPGVYMFGDMFQAQILSCSYDDLAISVLTSVTSNHPEQDKFLVDAGALALSKDHSTANVPDDVGFGRVNDIAGKPFDPPLNIVRVYQEHGKVPMEHDMSLNNLAIGTRLRVYPNHVCMMAAMYNRYYVVDSRIGDGLTIVDTWERTNGW